MDFLSHLWLPILVSAAAVWVAAAVCWMALPHHQDDHKGLPDEAGFVALLKGASIPPGNYGFPHCGDRAQMKDPEFCKRWKEGPTGMLHIWGTMSMGRNMVLSFLVYLVVSTLIAYLGSVVFATGTAGFSEHFRVLGTAGVLAYSFAFLPQGIWFNQYPKAMLMCVLDGIAFGLITGAIFAWLWPGA